MLVTFITMFTDISEYIITLSYLDTKYKYKIFQAHNKKTEKSKKLSFRYRPSSSFFPPYFSSNDVDLDKSKCNLFRFAICFQVCPTN